MILSDQAIIDAIATGEVTVDPPVSINDIRSFGVRIHLSNTLLVPTTDYEEIDLEHPEEHRFVEHVMNENGYLLDRHDYVLGCTRERIATSRSLGCLLDGRSSIARQGLFIHCSSGVIDNVHGEARATVLELFNCGGHRIRLRPGLAIGMLIFCRLEGYISQNAAQQYANQHGVVPPRPMSVVSGTCSGSGEARFFERK